MLLMLDNYDSFTYNLVQYFGELGEDVQVYRNDEITVEQVATLKPDHIVISPGPCAGCTGLASRGMRTSARLPVP